MSFSIVQRDRGQPAILAEGDFTPETASAFQAFLQRTSPPPSTDLLLLSRGGDLEAGIEVGRFIRKQGLNTSIDITSIEASQELGARSSAETAFCFSACSLAFLGGVRRTISPDAAYAVHQMDLDCVDRKAALQDFPWLPQMGISYCPELDDAMSMVQAADGKVIAYIIEMGARPELISAMAATEPSELKRLEPHELIQLGVVTTTSPAELPND